MLRLDAFGGLTLTDEGGRHVVSQRRRLALLAMLAAAGPRGCSRDKLIAVLWPESDGEHARHALEQLLYSLRRQLPAGLLEGTDPLRLDVTHVSADVWEFTARLAEGNPSGAVARYRGPFLDGFFLGDAPEFERWAERERSRLEGEHARALRGLARQAEGAGQTAEIDVRRRLAEANPLDEQAAVDLIRALSAACDWAGASRAAREFEAQRRAELLEEPPHDLAALVVRLRQEQQGPRGDAAAGRYEIQRELGRGAAATVYLARDRRVDRPVALKVLRPEVASATDARRFRREIAILARLHHPHILQLYDSGVLPAGAGPRGLFYVMPYVGGESLRRRLERESPLPVAEALAIARDVAEALAHAHASGVIHRDIRPENILLDSGHALVADFGIASVLETAGAGRLSESGVVLGAPAYVSPEQARGDAAIDGRSDIYSLGCVLYEMLAGEPPFSGATRAAVLAHHCGSPVPPLRTVRPELPASLEHAVVRALAKSPEQRFPTALDFLSACGA
jgi:DNA-binding SARP family transcriptional activator/tRNA A-37 threonylcarbamoyl transferase component Bud32